MIEGCMILDSTFSDTFRFPSFVELEVCSLGVTQIGRKVKDMHEPLCMDEYLPRLKALGRLPVRSPGFVQYV